MTEPIDRIASAGTVTAKGRHEGGGKKRQEGRHPREPADDLVEISREARERSSDSSSDRKRRGLFDFLRGDGDEPEEGGQ